MCCLDVLGVRDSEDPSAKKVDASACQSFFTWGLDGAEECAVTARPSKLM